MSRVAVLLTVAPVASVVLNVIWCRPRSLSAGNHVNSPVSASKTACLGREEADTRNGRFCASLAVASKCIGEPGVPIMWLGTPKLSMSGGKMSNVSWTTNFPRRTSIKVDCEAAPAPAVTSKGIRFRPVREPI